jgi:hypothetical protein
MNVPAFPVSFESLFHELCVNIENSIWSPDPPSLGAGERRKLDGIRVEMEYGLDFNAWAAANDDGTPAYGFRCGIGLVAKEIANHLMCEESFCTWIPFRNEKVIDTTSGSKMISRIIYAYPAGDGPRCVFSPQRYLETDPPGGTTPRIRFSEMIARGIVKFFAYHEQAHYHLGHAHFMRSLHGKQALTEFHPLRSKLANSPEESERINFFMEHQADTVAFQTMYQDCFRSQKHLPEYGGYREDLATYVDFLHAHCIGIQVALGVFELFERDSCDKKVGVPSQRRRTHPTSLSRIMHSYRLFLDKIVFPTKDQERALEANNTFLINEAIIADALGIDQMTIDMVNDVVNDRLPEQCRTQHGAELSRYRNGGLDLMLMMSEHAPKKT